MKIKNFIDILGAEFYTGVPDSQLKPLCNYLMKIYGIDAEHHIIAANEGNCAAIAAGYHLATGRVPVVYMQNSGEGNIINTAASLLNRNIYAIPVIFIIGWRGEPGVHDEPQHIYQGQVTLNLLDDMDIESFIVSQETTDDDVCNAMNNFRKVLKSGRDVAFVIRKGAFTDAPKIDYYNDNEMSREEVIRHIVRISQKDPIISTTGKASRELFEIREANKQSHEYDFLTVGSMGHCSSIALGVALNKRNQKVWCIDGDGAALMHMGAMAIIGNNKPRNLIHIIINNGAHESVGGMPTVANNMDWVGLAKACGYPYAISISNLELLDKELAMAQKRDALTMLEIKCALGSRKNLGRPTTTSLENKHSFMNYLLKYRATEISL